MALTLGACGPQVQPPQRSPAPQATPWQTPASTAPERQRVGLLLPLSGGNASLGHAMLNAAQLALFDQRDARVEFVPHDTRGTPSGAADAARAALAAGAGVLVGPLTLAETRAAADVARGAGAPLLAFTSDENLAGNGVWVAGLGPRQLGERLAEFTRGRGRRVGLVAPDNEFSRRLAEGMRAGMSAAGQPAPVVALYRGDAAGGARTLALAATGGLDVVVIGTDGAEARALAAALAPAGLDPLPRIFGTHLWAGDAALAQEPALRGAFFPGPDPGGRQGFPERFQRSFGEPPPRLAGTAYDAAALAARAARDGRRELPVGEAFQGADGPIRLLPGGGLARGLALFELRDGEARLREPALVPGTPGT